MGDLCERRWLLFVEDLGEGTAQSVDCDKHRIRAPRCSRVVKMISVVVYLVVVVVVVVVVDKVGLRLGDGVLSFCTIRVSTFA